MIFVNPFEQFKTDALSELPETTFGVHFGVNSLKLHNCHMNPSNPLSMFTDSIRCINLIMHTYCALHRCHADCCFLSGVCLLSIERDSEVKASNATDEYLSLKWQVKLYFWSNTLFSQPGKHNLLSAHLCFRSNLNLIPACDSKYLQSLGRILLYLHYLNILIHST